MSVAMLFDMRPKVGRHDLYGREAELASMLAALESATPLILLLGQRRIGKTSLLKTSLAEARRPYIYLDMRRLDEEGYSKVVLYRLLSEEMTRLNSTWKKLGEALKRVKGVQVAGTGIELDWSRTGLLLSSLFNSLDRWAEGNKIVVAIDEAQLFKEGKELIRLADSLADSGKTVIVSLLNRSHLGEPFGDAPEMMTRADYVITLTAVCRQCGGEAAFTQRIDSEGKPVFGELIEIGGKENHEPRCRSCFVRPND